MEVKELEIEKVRRSKNRAGATGDKSKRLTGK